MTAQDHAIEQFKKDVWSFYAERGRDLPWRRTDDPYAILVSEVMLQQTQVTRVIPKYAEFLEAFPSVASLAGARVAEVLAVWQGLGYNRRALALQRAATAIMVEHHGVIPQSISLLQALPGIGRATAAAVCVYAFDQPVVFIETNVRAAFIHHFFQEGSLVSDAELLPLVELTLDQKRPRHWYWALMDYGTWLKKTQANPGRRSAHHVAQSPFAGSRRQARAAVLRAVLSGPATGLALNEVMRTDPVLASHSYDEMEAILTALVAEGFVLREDGRYRVP